MSSINFSNPTTILLALGILAFILFRQMQASPMNPRRLLLIPALLAYGTLQYMPALSGIDVIGATLAVVGVAAGLVLGALRGLSIRTWTAADGTAWTQGTRTTLALWGFLIAFRIAMAIVDRLFGLGTQAMLAEMLMTLFATFAAQNLVTWLRAGGGLTLAAVRE